MQNHYVAVDVETTGLDRYEDAIIEVAAVVFQGEEILDEWVSFVDPEQELPPEISSITGITPRMLAGAPTIYDLRGQLQRLLADHIIVGHNVAFDMGFLERTHIGARQHRVDTITLASILLPTAGRYSLEALSRHLNLPAGSTKQEHRALSDARRTVDLFLELRRRAMMLDFALLEEIVQAGQSLNWPETIFFQEVLQERGRTAFNQGSSTGDGRARVRRLYKPPKIEGRALVAQENPQPIDVDTVAGMLQPGGNFSRAFPGYEYRPQQVQMVTAVGQAFNHGDHLIVEAGTGTGKSVGYLLPAAFWAHQNDRPVVVSTNTINLQDQLIHKDIPELQKLLPFDLRATVLKGRRNYVCTRLFQQMRHKLPGDADEMTLFGRLLVWLPQTERGDVNEISLRTPGEKLAWSRLSADNDGCHSEQCAEERCPLHIARRRAELAHIIIANHSLVLADVATGNRILPFYQDLIIDEAHHLEAAVTDGLSFQADKRFLEVLLEEMTRPRAGLIGDLQNRISSALPADVARDFNTQVNSLRADAGLAQSRLEEFFMAVDFFLHDQASGSSPFALQIRLQPHARKLPLWDEVDLAWENLNNVLVAIVKRLQKMAKGLEDLLHYQDIEDGDELLLAFQALGGNMEETRANIHRIIADPQEDMIYWVELYRRRISLHAAPLHVGPLVENYIFHEKETVVLTSATLRTAHAGRAEASFDYLRERLHAGHAEELAVGSPFDYKTATLLYLVSDMPEPRHPGYQRYVEEAIVAVAKALGGRTLVLFTSYGQLATTGRAIAAPLAEADLTLWQQSTGGSRQQLLEAFKAPDARGVLLGTRSFWEGVDVPGDALQAVVIAKLPFDVPSDPVFASRSETFENPFFQYAIPEAVLRFRQGFGRLIRRQADEGIVIVLDKRVLTKRYGQAFLDVLPECTVIRQRHARLAELVERWMKRDKS
jgi:DNA polymerase-3 subunit epsilon/ATP-dependent DNA helicase DinG